MYLPNITFADMQDWRGGENLFCGIFLPCQFPTTVYFNGDIYPLDPLSTHAQLKCFPQRKKVSSREQIGLVTEFFTTMINH